MKSKTSPFSGNLIYWRKRICKYILIPSTKIQLIKKQKGRCLSCGRFFRSGDVIGSENIILNNFKNQKNYKNKVQIIHNYCHLKKTKKKMLETHRNIKLK
jgi:RNA-directed DNA polymerase